MPNWCMNNATITGPIDKLEALVEAIENNAMLEHMNPIGAWDYGKATSAWGTKWEPNEVDYELDTDNQTLALNFDSAWGPPTTAYEEAEKRLGVSITASFYEPGMCFIGSYDDLEEEVYNFDFEDEEWRDTVPQDLIDDWGLEDEYENWKDFQDDEELD